MMRIRQIKLHEKTGVGSFLTRAERIGAYTVASERKGLGYIVAPGEISIVTAHGYIRMDLESAKRLIDELNGIIADIADLRRMGVVV